MSINDKPYIPGLSTDAIRERKSWQFRTLEYTRAGATQLGAFIVAMLGRRKRPPCFHPCGVKIDTDGQVWALFDDGTGFQARVAYPSVTTLCDEFRGLADVLKLTDAERIAMFSEVQKFVVKDERAVSKLF